MRSHLISALVLTTTLAFVASAPVYAGQYTDETRPCFPVAVNARLAPPLCEVASLEELNLPPIKTLTAQSDYTAFVRPNVPEEIMRQALRKLWLSDPVFAFRDALNVYDFDYKGFPDEQRDVGTFAQAFAQ